MNTKTNINPIILLLPVFIFLASCGQQKAEWKGTIEEVDGVTYVRNPKEGIWDSEQKANVTLTKVAQIGELVGPEEFLFVYISDVTVSSKGDIYIADRQLCEIRKFNKEGEHLLTIGRQGQGPGEFQDIRVITTNVQDDLIVFDNMLARVSIYSDKGELIKTTKDIMAGSWISTSKLFVSGENYVFFGKLSNSIKLFHEFGPDWNIKESYIDYEFIDNKEFEKQSLGGIPGHCFFQSNGDILYTKHFYDNQIFAYKNKELTRIISRESDIKKPYEVKVFHNVKKALSMQRDKEYDFRSFGQGIAFFCKSNQNSLGVFQLSDGHIVNFLSTRKSKDMRELGVEFFDSSGKFLGYTKLGENLYYDVRCMDSSDLFYAIDRKDYDKVILFRLGY